MSTQVSLENSALKCRYSPQFAVLMDKLNISLLISTNRSNKLIILSSVSNDKLIQLPRIYPHVKCSAIKDNRLVVASLFCVDEYSDQPSLAKNYPNQPNVYDSIYLPRATYYTGPISLQDIAIRTSGEIVAVNTLFSCLCTITPENSFIPFWQPPFITKLVPENRCQLSGFATEDDEIRYVTAYGETDTNEGWLENAENGGVLMEYPSGRIISEGLSMPNSPRIINGKLYFLNSKQGELVCCDPESGELDVIYKTDGFLRGMESVGDYLFIGVSKIGTNKSDFIEFSEVNNSFTGIIAFYLPYKSIVSTIIYDTDIEEVFDVKVINAKRPALISPDMDIHRFSISSPDASYWGKMK